MRRVGFAKRVVLLVSCIFLGRRRCNQARPNGADGLGFKHATSFSPDSTCFCECFDEDAFVFSAIYEAASVAMNAELSVFDYRALSIQYKAFSKNSVVKHFMA